jgi:hypothetical protein
MKTRVLGIAALREEMTGKARSGHSAKVIADVHARM